MTKKQKKTRVFFFFWAISKLWFFQWSCMDVRVGLWRKLSAEELMLWTVVLEKTLESPLDCKEIQQVHSKGDGSWVFIGRTDAKAETPILWPPHAKSWLIGIDSDAGRDWGQEEKGTTEDEMAGWHHRLNWTWVWVNSGSWWWTGRPGVLRFTGSQWVGHDWATERNWTDGNSSMWGLSESWFRKADRSPVAALYHSTVQVEPVRSAEFPGWSEL